MAAAALISIRLGERRRDEAEHVLGHALVLLLLVAVLLTAVGLSLLDPLLRAVGASDASQPYAREYLQIIVAGSIFQTLGFGLNAAIRGEGNPRVAMMTLLIGALLNTRSIRSSCLCWGGGCEEPLPRPCCPRPSPPCGF